MPCVHCYSGPIHDACSQLYGKAKSIALPVQLNLPSSLKMSLGIYAHTSAF